MGKEVKNVRELADLSGDDECNSMINKIDIIGRLDQLEEFIKCQNDLIHELINRVENLTNVIEKL